jgi:PPK2 family polyphosphate:nucleotide phosphotransferase
MEIDKKLFAKPGMKINLDGFDTSYTGIFNHKKEGKKALKKNKKKLKKLQDKLFAHYKYSILIVFQAMDAGGKDSTIKHVMSGVNPQGCRVTTFKKPSTEELDHDFLWRAARALPARGMIGIFNRSHYEEVLITRVHKELILKQKLPGIHHLNDIGEDFWLKRFENINAFEQNLAENGTVIIKFFLNVSWAKQRKRFLKRINREDKNWKFTMADIEERKYWGDYRHAYEQAIQHTSTNAAPWYIIPADHKWYMRAAVGDIVLKHLEDLPLKYPELSPGARQNLSKAKAILEKEE